MKTRTVILFLAFVTAFFIARCGKADIITSFGGGPKSPYSTSIVLHPKCHAAVPLLREEVEQIEQEGLSTQESISTVGDRRLTSCGGNNPMFVGWPLAWQSRDFGKHGALSVRAGWFHFSHWTDGGRRRETHLDCACFEFTMNWSERRRGRRATNVRNELMGRTTYPRWLQSEFKQIIRTVNDFR